MPLSTDSVLLGAWATPFAQQATKAIDVGTGTGILAIMLAQSYPQLAIDAVEIEPRVAEVAYNNIRSLSFPHAITPREGDFVAMYRKRYQPHSIDFIISNPPYFQQSIPPKGVARQLARVTNRLETKQLFEAASELLRPEGLMALVAPFSERRRLCTEALGSGLFLAKEVAVITQEGKPPKRLLTLWQRRETTSENSLSHSFSLRASELIIRLRDGSYSPAYRELVAPFYQDRVFQ